MHVTLIPGSGLGPEIAEVACAAVAAAGVSIDWDLQADGLDAMVASVRRTGLALKGKILSPVTPGTQPFTIRFRKALGVHAIVRHVVHVPGLPARVPATDIVIVREASEDIYSGFEHESTAGVFESVKVTTRAACERIATFAFDYAQARGRKRVTTVHKANILKKSDGMFLATSREVAARYPSIQHDDIIVDALCMRLVRRPTDFDVLLCGNLFGDIVSDCAAGKAGGITVAGGICHASPELGGGAVIFESPHGTSVEIVGPDGANPYALTLLAADLCAHIGRPDAAVRIRGAVSHALTSGLHTQDMGGTATTSAIRDSLLSFLR